MRKVPEYHFKSKVEKQRADQEESLKRAKWVQHCSQGDHDRELEREFEWENKCQCDEQVLELLISELLSFGSVERFEDGDEQGGREKKVDVAAIHVEVIRRSEAKGEDESKEGSRNKEEAQYDAMVADSRRSKIHSFCEELTSTGQSPTVLT